MSELNLQQVRETFSGDKFATEVTGIEIVAVAENYAKCELSIEGRHRNTVGAVMGGAIFTLADFCYAVAANAEKLSAVTESAHIMFLNQVRGKKLIAEAKCLKSGRRNCYFEISITDELGTSVAVVTEVGCKIDDLKDRSSK